MSSITSIQNRLKALESAVKGMVIPSEQEFWEQWKDFDPLTKSVYEAVAECRVWETEKDPMTRKYFEVCSTYLLDAGHVTPGKSILEIAAELEACNGI